MEKTRLLINSNPFLINKENSLLFLESLKENILSHYHHHPYIKALCDEANWKPEQIKNEEDLFDIPYIVVSLFKQFQLKSVPDNEIVLHLTSSGTGGKKSHQFLNQESLDNVKKSAWMIHEALGLVDDKKYNYFCFTYDPKIANDLGTAFTDELLTSFTPKNEVYYCFEWNDEKNDFIFDQEKALKKLKDFDKSPFPIRILGFPAFLHQLVTEQNLKLKLHPDSWIQTGGGWKGLADKEIPKSDFRALMEERLGVSQKNIRDMFGMVEHGIPYVDCEKGNLHIPNYSRVIIRDPLTLRPLEKNQLGLIQFICTYNFSYPAFNILATDYGMISTCSCELGGDILILKGRAGVSKHKGCAVKALELLEDKK
jgi:phenylacetate-coenzyme A ligase PaaK-like adenylate-forming protein